MNKIYNLDVLEGFKKIQDHTVNVIITSPPYNLDIQYKNHQDYMPYEAYLKWLFDVWKESKRVLVEGGRLCINIGENKRQDISQPTFTAFINQLLKLKMLYRGMIIWNKNNSAKHCAWGSWCSPSNPHLVPIHEYIIVFSKNTYKMQGKKEHIHIEKKDFMDYTKTVWSFGTESKKKIGHPAPFPLELPKRLIKFYSYEKDVILDPFGGSGTTGLAAVLLDRNYILIEHCKEYCDIAENRILKEKQQLKLFTTNL